MQSRNHVVILRPRGSKYLEQKESMKKGKYIKNGSDEEEPRFFM